MEQKITINGTLIMPEVRTMCQLLFTLGLQHTVNSANLQAQMSLTVLSNGKPRTINGDAPVLYQYVIKVFDQNRQFQALSITDQSYLAYINTQLKRNHDRLLKLLLTQQESIEEEKLLFEELILPNFIKELASKRETTSVIVDLAMYNYIYSMLQLTGLSKDETELQKWMSQMEQKKDVLELNNDYNESIRNIRQ